MLAATFIPSAGFVPGLAPAQPVQVHRAVAPVMETLEGDLKPLASKLNPVVGYWDPLRLAEAEFWDYNNEETIGWLRHAEIKHGRIAMAAFVGYIVQANGIKFPWAPFDSITATSPPDQWDALPDVAKWQIILGVGFLEWWSEIRIDGTAHYMKGGKPGYYPPFSAVPSSSLPHPLPFDLYDPFKYNVNMTPEQKSKGLLTEINNGRLAMLGIMGFLSEAKVPGAVPFLKGLIPEYGGEVMLPFNGLYGI